LQSPYPADKIIDKLIIETCAANVPAERLKSPANP